MPEKDARTLRREQALRANLRRRKEVEASGTIQPEQDATVESTVQARSAMELPTGL
jgi:hypothetical protein